MEFMEGLRLLTESRNKDTLRRIDVLCLRREAMRLLEVFEAEVILGGLSWLMVLVVHKIDKEKG